MSQCSGEDCTHSSHAKEHEPAVKKVTEEERKEAAKKAAAKLPPRLIAKIQRWAWRRTLNPKAAAAIEALEENSPKRRGSGPAKLWLIAYNRLNDFFSTNKGTAGQRRTKKYAWRKHEHRPLKVGEKKVKQYANKWDRRVKRANSVGGQFHHALAAVFAEKRAERKAGKSKPPGKQPPPANP